MTDREKSLGTQPFETRSDEQKKIKLTDKEAEKSTVRRNTAEYEKFEEETDSLVSPDIRFNAYANARRATVEHQRYDSKEGSNEAPSRMNNKSLNEQTVYLDSKNKLLRDLVEPGHIQKVELVNRLPMRKTSQFVTADEDKIMAKEQTVESKRLKTT